MDYTDKKTNKRLLPRMRQKIQPVVGVLESGDVGSVVCGYTRTVESESVWTVMSTYGGEVRYIIN